ncbi:hypothetical protein HK101_011873 [Irineochytrium annulatum]|nr:hypothetical protein HK101_011873 [Irineochytrium annulatum]
MKKIMYRMRIFDASFRGGDLWGVGVDPEEAAGEDSFDLSAARILAAVREAVGARAISRTDVGWRPVSRTNGEGRCAVVLLMADEGSEGREYPVIFLVGLAVSLGMVYGGHVLGDAEGCHERCEEGGCETDVTIAHDATGKAAVAPDVPDNVVGDVGGGIRGRAWEGVNAFGGGIYIHGDGVESGARTSGFKQAVGEATGGLVTLARVAACAVQRDVTMEPGAVAVTSESLGCSLPVVMDGRAMVVREGDKLGTEVAWNEVAIVVAVGIVDELRSL